jgi:hypothetical protein
LAYAEWSVHPADFDVDDRAGWAQANPSLGLRISEEFIADELAEVGEAEFIRERLGVPDADPSSAVRDRPISDDVWALCEDPASRRGDVVRFGLSVHPSRTWAAITAASMRPDGTIHVELVDAGPGVAWVVPRAVDVCNKWSAPIAVEAGGPSGGLLPDLQAEGVEVVALPRRDVVAAFGRMSDLAVAAGLAHTGQAQLTAAVLVAERRPSGDQFVWVQHGPDITPLYAAALAVWQVAVAEPDLPAIF